MSNQNFVDYIRVFCRSGKGGAGAVHFYRAKYIPKGGPDGGDGGRGGHIIAKGNSNLWTLLHLRYTKHLYAEDGQAGSGNLCTGAAGKDIVIEVPLGTVIRNSETGEFIAEVTHHDETVVVLPGGRGGKGNDFFKTATHQTPRFAQPGEPGIEAWLSFELKILADVGLVGFPNAGKSTLLSVVSAAKPQIADYAFTTLTPNLGMVEYRDGRSFVMADIPGIIEGAHQGRGLGLRFLRHIERNPVLLFMIPVTSDNISKEYKILLNELKQFNPELLDKQRILAITKADLMDEEMLNDLKNEFPKGIKTVIISSVTGQGISRLKDELWNILNTY